MRTFFGKKDRYFASQSGMTFVELLGVVLIFSMVMLVIGTGVGTVSNVCRKITRKAQAERILAATAELLRDELACALDVKDKELEAPEFLSGNTGSWIRLEADAERGIYRYGAELGENEQELPFLSSGAMAEYFYTTFDCYTYDDGCFTVTGLAVYEKCDAEKEMRVPAAFLSELTVRAVNLEAQEWIP